MNDLGEDAVVDTGVRYVRSGGVAIAYHMVGEGDVDLVYVPDYASNLVSGWERAGERSTSASRDRAA